MRRASEKGEKVLVDKALSKGGRLFDCDPTKADRAFVFTRGYMKASDVKQEVHAKTGIPLEEIKVYSKIGDNITEDVLIFLKNPYGGSPEAYRTEGTLEKRIYDIIQEAIKYIEENPTDIIEYLGYSEHTKEFLRKYFYGENELRDELKNCIVRLENGEKPIFIRPLRIFGERGSIAGTKVYSEQKQALSLDESEIQSLIRGELNKFLCTEECVQKLKRILKE
ncbi:MAG: hypothetical protein MUO26_04890 [Methanotrichaceae archaeon]|nr:hypothetical protein [Methanotrichaceae archaeon]